MNTYFPESLSVGDVKRVYHRLAKNNHPDMGGDTQVMQAINAAYLEALSRLDGTVYQGTDRKDHTYRYKANIEQEVIDKLAALYTLKMTDITIELVGTWLWIYGDDKPHKEELKKLGCRWHSKRGKWYWRKFDHRRKFSGVPFQNLRNMYGSQEMQDSDSLAMV